jgi:cytochrome c-type biogenesis protein CcmH
MILAMVGNLAARLEKQPDDIEGWARLGRSYMVLNEPQKARDAYAHAVKLKPDDTALKEAFEAAQSAAAKTESGAQ